MTESGEDLLTKALAEAIAQLSGPRRLTVVEVTVSGITTFGLRRDETGTPRCRFGPPVPWTDLAGDPATDPPEEATEEQVLLAAVGVPPGSEVFLVCGSPDDPPTAQVMEWLRAARPEATAFTRPGARVETLLREILLHEPLCRSYDLVVLKRHPETGRLELSSHPLFLVGARRGDTLRVQVRCDHGDEYGTAFAVVAWQGPRPRLLSVQTARLTPGRYDFTAELERPGRVRFVGLPGLVRDDRDWAELIAAVPAVLGGEVEPAHLICAVEVSGAAKQVDERLIRVRQMITVMSGGTTPELVVSLVAYGAHSYDRRATQEPVEVAGWLMSPEQALHSLTDWERRGATTPGYPYAAQVEDMLAEVADRLGKTEPRRTVLLTVGDRPPHPPRVHRSEILPCPDRHDWELLLAWIERRAGMTLGAICDRPPEQADPIWQRLGGGAPIQLEVADVRRLGDDLGLSPPKAQRIPFPLIETP
ncbi:hypothetical protein [Streptosporangium sp. KLBMP 9127]|nr:hypothetical protein [Streptosporangium sp. KLBMP 9127]